MNNIIKIILSVLVVTVVSVWAYGQRQMYPPWPPKDQAGAWEIKIAEKNQISMTRHFPYGAVDRWLTIFPTNDISSPENGTVRFANGITREMTRGELSYFWEFAGAKEAYELYRKQKRSDR